MEPKKPETLEELRDWSEPTTPDYEPDNEYLKELFHQEIELQDSNPELFDLCDKEPEEFVDPETAAKAVADHWNLSK